MLVMMIAVAGGGALGSLLRLLITSVVHRLHATAFPVGILICNVLGSLLIGVLIGYFFHRQDSIMWQRFLVIGLCGGFTTFSSFSLDTVMLLQTGHALQAGINIVLSVVLCLIATWIGLKMMMPQ